jgi:hypothetical protein
MASHQQSFDDSAPAANSAFTNPLQTKKPDVEPIEESEAQEEDNAD